MIPANRINQISKDIQALYPAPNNPGTNNGLQNNLFVARAPVADRHNFDVKVNWNRTSAHQIWAKFSMMDAIVSDLFYLGLDGVGSGFTETYIGTVGQTWTLSPTLLLDGNISTSSLPHTAQGSGLRHQLRPGCLRHPRHEQRRRDGARVARPRVVQRHARVQHRSVGARPEHELDTGVA